ncbi:hypothetical protein J2TS4_38410 [Paenibacillus sp. J2TS4]|nr:hypothetical protein J2TS4_38410 [Paenibacillus sp. J2TS4]
MGGKDFPFLGGDSSAPRETPSARCSVSHDGGDGGQPQSLGKGNNVQNTGPYKRRKE